MFRSSRSAFASCSFWFIDASSFTCTSSCLSTRFTCWFAVISSEAIIAPPCPCSPTGTPGAAAVARPPVRVRFAGGPEFCVFVAAPWRKERRG